jgi:hypothetical protein
MRKEEVHAKIQRILQIILEIQSYDKIDITFTLSSELKTLTVQAFAGKKRHDVKDFIVNTNIDYGRLITNSRTVNTLRRDDFDLLTEELLRILNGLRKK